MQEDRQDFYEDEVDDYWWHGDADDFAAGMLTGFVVGTTLSAAQAQSMSASSSSGSQPSCTMTTVPVADTTYYRCGPNWFQKAYTGGQVSYVVVAPPPGY
jgi:hypothetical protein